MKTTLRLSIAAFGLAIFTLSTVVVQAGDYTYTTTNGTITITGGCPSGPGTVIIPETINGLPVTSIGEMAFYECNNLTSVTIPDSVTSIGHYAFYYCTSLTSVTIPDSVTSIGDWAFYGCTSLTSVSIPQSVTSIGGWAFYDCRSLTAITVDALNPTYSSVEGVLFNKSQTTLILCPWGKAGSFTVPNSVTSIGDWAFNQCWSLTGITIPNSVTSIGVGAFNYCTSLTNITIPNSVTGIGDGAFDNCFSLTSVTIGNSVTSIGGSAFSGCTSLTTITIPNSVTYIGLWAFYNCFSLTSVTIGNSVTNIGFVAFSFCTSLTNVTIPNSVTSIGGGAFSSCTSLTNVTIPNSVTYIGDHAFSGCISLTAITVDASNSVYSSVDGVLFNKSQSTIIQFPGGRAGSYIVPNSVTSIGDYAFSWCSSLTSVTIPNSVTSIGGWAFSWCSGLTSVNIPHSVTSIGGYAFSWCSSLTSVYFEGNAPQESDVFGGSPLVTVYYLPGTTGWGTVFDGRPTALWVRPDPVILTRTLSTQNNAFGFRISWATNTPVVIEGSTTLANPLWSAISTNTLTGGWSYFSDPVWTNYPSRFYRIRQW